MEIRDLLPVTASYDERGLLRIANNDLAALAREWGTPLYIYDAMTVRQQVSSLLALFRQLYPARFEIAYAAKAYFSLGFAQKLASLGLGVDVVSLGELAVARKAGFLPARIHLHGNNKSAEELKTALEWGVQAVVVDSLDELDFLEQLAEKIQVKGRIWLRIMPGISVETHQYTQTAHPASKFGLPFEDGQAAEAIRRARRSSWLSLTGLHVHLGSQFFEPEPYRLAIARLAELAERENFIPEEISPGGGWGVPYNLQGKTGDPFPWLDNVCTTIQVEFQKRGWPLPRLVIEPGRWIAARAGLAIYSVGAVKTAGSGARFVAVDGGMADNIRPALYQAQYMALPVESHPGSELHKCTLVGKFCETGDVLIQEIDLPDLKRGDLLAIPVSGAYHLSMASNYNLAPRPVVLWLEDGSIEVLQKREKIEDSFWWSLP